MEVMLKLIGVRLWDRLIWSHRLSILLLIEEARAIKTPWSLAKALPIGRITRANTISSNADCFNDKRIVFIPIYFNY
jgi:hypothetical protein